MSIEMDDGSLRIQQIIAQADEDIKSTQVTKDIPLELDLGNLMVEDINPLEENNLKIKSKRDEVLRIIARDSVQKLVTDVYSLERTRINNFELAILPAPVTVLPREKPIPKPLVLTKWEQYAKEKGIKKRKKERKIWDETIHDFVPRYGKLKVQVEKDKNWVLEVPRQADPYEDQFAKAAAAKKERIAKNEYQRLRNIARAKKTGVPGVGVTRTDTNDVGELKKAMHFSLQSTASLGKFQPSLKNERPISGFKKNSRREVDRPFVGTVRDEKMQALNIIQKIRKPIVNTDTNIIKQIEKNMVMEKASEHRAITKTGRRSKMGGRRDKKSGAALVSLTDGKVGDKKSKKVHAAAKAEAIKAGGKKGAKAAAGGKKGKSAFGGAMGKKSAMTKAGGKTKNVVKKRRR